MLNTDYQHFLFDSKIASTDFERLKKDVEDQTIKEMFIAEIAQAINCLSEIAPQNNLQFLVSDWDFEIMQASLNLRTFVSGDEYSEFAFIHYYLNRRYNKLASDYWFLAPSFLFSINNYKKVLGAEFDYIKEFALPIDYGPFRQTDPYSDYYKVDVNKLRKAVTNIQIGFLSDIDRDNLNKIKEIISKVDSSSVLILRAINQ